MNTIKYSTNPYNVNRMTMSAGVGALLDNEYYITRVTFSIHSNGNTSEGNLKGDFGTYYDALMSIMNTAKYSVTNQQGRTDYYGLIDIDDFVNRVINLK